MVKYNPALVKYEQTHLLGCVDPVDGLIPKTIKYPRRITRIVLNGETCDSQSGRSIAGSPAF